MPHKTADMSWVGRSAADIAEAVRKGTTTATEVIEDHLAAIAARAGWGLWWRLPGVIAAYHFGYGIGSLWGWFDVLRGAAAGRERFARLTR